MFDGEAFGAEIVAAVRGYVDAELAARDARIADLESQLKASLEREPAIGIEAAAVADMISDAVAAIPPAKDGRDADPDVIERLVVERVDAAVAALPRAKDGADADPEAIRSMVAEAVSGLPPPEKGAPGLDVDMEEVRRLISAEVANLPRPADGKSIDSSEVERMVGEAVERAAGAIPKAKDGVGVAGAVIDRDGALILTLTDGQTRDLGRVVGRDGIDGAPGADGERGDPGFSLTDFDAQAKDGGRIIVLTFVQGDYSEVHELPTAIQIYRGVFRDGQAYEPGDTVTWAGSLWHCNEPTTDKPGEGHKAWTLAAKKGRDGKDGRPGEKGDAGTPGRPGKDGKGW